MDRKRFREFLHYNFDMTDDIIMDRIYKYFNTMSADDIDKQEWVLGFNVFLKGFTLVLIIHNHYYCKELLRNRQNIALISMI